WQMRILYPAAKVEMGFSTTRDSGIRTPYDLKPGVRLIYAAWLPEREAKLALRALLAWAKLKDTDVEWVPAANMGALTRLLMDGKGDVLFGQHPTSPAMYEVESSPRGLAWINLDAQADPEGAKRFLEVYDEVGFGPITSGVPSAVGTKGIVGISHYTCSADLNTDLVYNLVKWLHVNWEKYRKAHPWCESMTIELLLNGAETDYVPLHDGAVRYLRELGKWTPAHETRRQQNISLLTKYVDAYQATIRKADERGVTVSPENKEWLEMWAKARAELPPIRPYMGLS
ncbi:MAG: hypothetical protein N3E40_06835, partial [Dehalococcoidia bacterium]|nr:hypothetical protein [Dehalococcoidia bacterium]